MRNAIILHGTCDKEEYYSNEYPSLSNSHWIPWLQKQLLIKNIFTQTPEMPEAHDPQYDKWKREFERFEINKESILIGHSCGGGFLVRWLSENSVKIDKLVLVAPWLDPNKEKAADFFNFKIDKTLAQKINKIHMFVSEDDSDDILKSVNFIKKDITEVIIHELKAKGHFTFNSMKTNEFSELLEIIK